MFDPFILFLTLLIRAAAQENARLAGTSGFARPAGASRPAAGTDWLGRSFGFPKTPEGSATTEAVI